MVKVAITKPKSIVEAVKIEPTDRSEDIENYEPNTEELEETDLEDVKKILGLVQYVMSTNHPRAVMLQEVKINQDNNTHGRHAEGNCLLLTQYNVSSL